MNSEAAYKKWKKDASNDCPFQYRQDPHNKSVWHMFDQRDTAKGIIASGSKGVIHQQASVFNTEWFFQKYIG